MQIDPIFDRDFRECEEKLRRGSKSFAIASRLLPPRLGPPVVALYAFCREADDAIDADPTASERTVDHLRRRLDAIFSCVPGDSPVDRALSYVVHETRLPRRPLDALLEGLSWDACGKRYETLDDLEAYATRVAATIGALMTVLMGSRSAPVLARACDLGVAMQLTNIARDVGEDARRGRIYLPLSWMRDAGVDVEAFLERPSFDPRVGNVVARLLEEADHLYRRADEGIPDLPRDCRTAIYAARLIYSDIGRAIAHQNYDSVRGRAYVSAWRKLRLLFRSLRARWLRVPPRLAPPLEPARFLVAACERAT